MGLGLLFSFSPNFMFVFKICITRLRILTGTIQFSFKWKYITPDKVLLFEKDHVKTTTLLNYWTWKEVKMLKQSGIWSTAILQAMAHAR